MGPLSFRRARPAFCRAVLVTLALLWIGACSGSSSPMPRPPVRTSGPIWLATQAALRDLLADPTVHAGLARGRVYELLGDRQRPTDQVPVTTVTSYASEAAIRSAGKTSARYVLYDPEVWSHTPESEQRDPAAAMRRVAAIVHGRHQRLIVAPALNLTTALGARPGSSRWQAFLDLKLAADAARVADVVELQAQSLARDPDTYARFVAAAAGQARAVNRKITILAGISSNPPGSPVSSAALKQSMQKTRHTVEGYWINIPQPGPKCPSCNPRRPDVAVDALRALL